MIELGVVIGLSVVGLYALSRSFFRVEEGHVAVLTVFGAAQRHEDPSSRKSSHAQTEKPRALVTYGAGLHTKAPWAHVHAVSLMEQNLALSGDEGSTAMAADGTVLRFDSVLRIQPQQEELEQYLFGLRAPREHVMGLFSCLLRNEIANFGVRAGDARNAVEAEALATVDHEVGQSSYALILRNRQNLNARIEAFCRDEIADRYGLRFHGVDLTDILPPDELAEALNAMINAEKEAEEALSRAEAECAQQVLAASRGVAIAEARASAAEIEIAGLSRYLDDLRAKGVLERYVARRRAEVFAEARSTFVKGEAS